MRYIRIIMITSVHTIYIYIEFIRVFIYFVKQIVTHIQVQSDEAFRCSKYNQSEHSML